MLGPRRVLDSRQTKRIIPAEAQRRTLTFDKVPFRILSLHITRFSDNFVTRSKHIRNRWENKTGHVNSFVTKGTYVLFKVFNPDTRFVKNCIPSRYWTLRYFIDTISLYESVVPPKFYWLLLDLLARNRT